MLETILVCSLLLSPGGLEIEVEDRAGVPVPGALLEAAPLEGEGEPLEIVATEGKTSLEAAGTWLLVVRAEGFVPWTEEVEVPGDPLTVRLQRAAALEGHVRDGDKAVVSGVKIALRPTGETSVGSLLTSDAKGTFRIDGLAPGLYNLSLTKKGHIPAVEPKVSLRGGRTTRLELLLRRASALDLLVRGADGKPLEEAAATIVTEGDDGKHLPQSEQERLSEQEVKTDDEGRARLDLLPVGIPLRIAVHHPDHAPSSLGVLLEGAETAKEIRLQTGGALRLNLVDGEKAPVPGARVHLASADARDLDLVNDPPPTGEDGTLVLPHLPAGRYSLRIQAAGYRPRTVRGVEMADRGTAEVGPVEMLPGLVVAGRVLTEEEDPIPDAKVTAAFHEEGRKMEASAESDEEGRFRIEGLPEGVADVEAEAEGRISQEVPRVPAGTTDLELRLAAAGKVRGLVLDGATGDPVVAYRATAAWQEEEGKRRGRHRGKEFRDPDGLFHLEDLAEGRWIIHVIAEGYRPGRSEPVTVLSGDEGDAGTIELDRGRVLEGRVVAAGTDAEGRFHVEGQDNPTQLSVKHPAFVTSYQREVDLEETPFVTVRLERGGRIEGTVHGDDGDSLPGAEVKSWSHTALTDAGGRYRLDGEKPGTVVLTKVDVPGTKRGHDRARVEVKAGETTLHDFGTGARLHGTVTRSGRPATNAVLTLYESEYGEGMSTAHLRMRTATTGEDGAYLFTGLAEGSYTLNVMWEGRRFGREIGMGSEPQRFNIEIPDLEIAGRVVEDATEEFLGGIRLTAYLVREDRGSMSAWEGGRDGLVWSTNPLATDVTDTEGRFRLLIGEPGKWQVHAAKQGYSMLSEQETTFEVKSSLAGVVIRLQGSAVLAVRVADAETGAAIAAGMVSLQWGTRSEGTQLDGSGSTVFRGVSPGAAELVASASGYAPAWKHLELEAGGRSEETLMLDRGGTLRLVLPPGLAPRGQRLWEIGLALVAEDGTDLTRHFPFDSDDAVEEGVALLRHVPDGRIVVRLGKKGGPTPPRETTVSVPLGGEVTADLR